MSALSDNSLLIIELPLLLEGEDNTQIRCVIIKGLSVYREFGV